ncbi:MAG: hypothetical protein QM680_00950 [Luteolibacter sp.]
MNELQQKLVELGLSQSQAGLAINTVAEFAKSKLPDNFDKIIDEFLAGKNPDFSDILGSLGGLGGLGNLFK